MLVWGSLYPILGLVISAFNFFTANRKSYGRLPYPPGPKGLPIIGNLFDVFLYSNPWLTFDSWFNQYGPIVSFHVFGKRFILLGTLDKVYDLFETRSSLYSSRPRLPMLIELMGLDLLLPLMPYGAAWRRQRKIFHDLFHPNVVEQYVPSQTKGTRIFLHRLLKSPKDFIKHIDHSFNVIMMDITFGLELNTGDVNQFAKNLEKCVHQTSDAARPGRYLVDSIPALQYLPSWFPGAEFKRKANRFKKFLEVVLDGPWNYAIQRINSGDAVPSITTVLTDGLDESQTVNQEKIRDFKHVAMTSYMGGFDTSSSVARTFLFAMTMYPEVQRKAQQEIDSVIGSKRLPEHSDKTSLPYIQAIVKETMRWKPVTPLAFVHTVTKDDVYDGYYIPKGSLVLGNVWTLLHDPEVYPDPEEFKPERFLKDGKLDPSVRNPNTAAFGFGRRICPGRFFSGNSMFLFVSAVLATFNIEPSRDADGNPIKLDPKMTDASISTLLPFECIITPRSAAAEELIRGSQEF